jgi:di/tricarboxylate transporter
MTTPQIAILAIFAVTLVFFISEKIRYDVVALGALFVCVLVGLVPADKAFNGFANDAVITVAAVLVMSHALAVSGAVDVISHAMARVAHRPLTLLASLTILGASLSAFMNNVGALALLMPIAMAGARHGGFAPARLLMPISFATMLGGMITLVGTPPNLLASEMRERLTGKDFAMFDFAPAGLAITAAGLLYLIFVGWRFLPGAREGQKPVEEMFDVGHYVTEAEVAEKSPLAGQTVGEFEQSAGEGVVALGLIHGKRRLRAHSGYVLQVGDVLLLQAETAELQELIKAGAIRMVPHHSASEAADGAPTEARPSSEFDTMEVVVTPTSWIQGSTAKGLRLRARFDANLLAISRRGRPVSSRLRDVKLFAGDVLLLEGRASELPDTIAALGCLPLADRRLKLAPRKVVMPFVVLAGAVALVVAGIVPPAVGFALGALAMVVLRILPLRQMYDGIEWPVIVLLGALIPMGAALESTGAAQLIADGIVAVAGSLPTHALLALVMIATMAVTPALNNAATVLIMGPIAHGIAQQLGVESGSFIMAVAIGASCDFLTPFGHQNNTLIMGPGGYRFADFWRVGLLLDVIVVTVGVAVLPLVFPFR